MIPTETGMLPANPMMEALWWVHHRSKNKSVYNLTWPMTCERQLDFDALRVAWQAMVDRHEALRASLHQHDGAVLLAIADHVDVEPERVQIADPGSMPVDRLLRSIAEELHERPVALDRAPTARLTLVSVGDQDELVLTVHHALLDGWSLQLLMTEFAEAYATAAAGGTPSFATEPVSLAEHMRDANAARVDGRWDESLKYWRDRLDGAMTTTLVADRHRYTGTGNKGEIIWYRFSDEALQGATAVAEQFYVTPFTVMLAALQTVLARGGAGPDVCTGTVTANRMTQQEQGMVGNVANLVLVRTEVNDDDTFAAVVERTRQDMWEVLANQRVPFSLVYGALTESAQALLRDNIPLIMSYYGPIGSGVHMGDVKMRMQPAPNRAARTDLGIGVLETDTGLIIESEYNTGRYDRETVLRLFHDIDTALATFGPDPHRLVSTLEVGSKAGPAYVEHELTADDLGTTVMPESASLDQVRRAWLEVLGTEPVGPDEDFFVTGGRSLKVVQLASAIEAETGVRLDVTQWLADPTPRRAAEQIGGSVGGSVGSTLISFREGAGTHLHLIPGGGGSVQDYRELIAELPEDWRITFSQEREPLDSVPAMARRYRADLDVAGVRPDLVAGWSMGGQVAFELALTYSDGSPKVALVDSTPPLGYGAESKSAEWVYDGFVASIAHAFGVTVEGARTSPGDELSMRVFAAQLAVLTGESVSAAMLVDRWRTFRRHTAAVLDHRAEGRLSASGVVVAAALADYQFDEWDGLFGAAPRRLRVAADHYTALRAPAVAEVAAAIVALRDASV
jgi:thioesterase domain-containing protein